ncbi:MAG TPA: PAS domain-containing protein [Campylobacterales bacterium]|nr:PAS domain-containing protein [Campylobacterales bacterium]
MKNTLFIKLLRIVFIVSFFIALLLAAATIWRLLGEIDNIAKIAVSETESLKAQTVALRERASILMTLFLFILFSALGLLVIIAGYIRERFDKIEAALNGRNETLIVRTEELEELNHELDASYEEIAQANETLQIQAYQLEISEERYRQMFENMRSGVAIYEAVDDGMDFVFKSFNSAAEKIESLKREQVLQKRLSEIFPGVGDFGFLQALKEVNESGKAQNFPIGFYEDNRISGWRENFIYKLTTGEIVVIYDDITERKKAEEELKESKYFLQTIIEMEPECVKIIDDKGRLIFMNSAGLEMIEADSLEQVAGRSVLGIIAPEHQYSYAKLHKRVLGGRTYAYAV